MNNIDLVKFALNKLKTPYVMGTNGKILTLNTYNDLCRRNPANWFTLIKKQGIKKYINTVTTDCHGLIEWFVRENTGKNYDVTADSAYAAAKVKGDIKSIPEIAGLCVRYSGHVGIYIGNGYVVEARGFNYGVCITKLSERKWKHWYKHPMISYDKKEMPEPAYVTKRSSKYDIAWLQIMLNKQINLKRIKVAELIVDGYYGSKTANAVQAFRRYKKWSTASTPYSIGTNTIKAFNV